MFYSRNNKGFSLVEIMVVIGIIVTLLSVVMTFLLDARKSSRDKARVSDLAQIEFALNAYREVNLNYPNFSDGIIIGQGEAIDEDLQSYWRAKINDPVNDEEHYYYYDSDFECGEKNYIAVLANKMENERSSNVTSVCEDSAFAGGYVVLLYGPLSESGSNVYTNVDGDDEWWNDPENQIQNNPPGGGEGGV